MPGQGGPLLLLLLLLQVVLVQVLHALLQPSLQALLHALGRLRHPAQERVVLLPRALLLARLLLLPLPLLPVQALLQVVQASLHHRQGGGGPLFGRVLLIHTFEMDRKGVMRT